VFNIKIKQLAVDAIATVIDYVIFELMRIDVNQIIAHIEDQGSFAWVYYELLKMDAQKTIVTKIVMYTMMLIVSLNGIKVECDNAN